MFLTIVGLFCGPMFEAQHVRLTYIGTLNTNILLGIMYKDGLEPGSSGHSIGDSWLQGREFESPDIGRWIVVEACA